MNLFLLLWWGVCGLPNCYSFANSQDVLEQELQVKALREYMSQYPSIDRHKEETVEKNLAARRRLPEEIDTADFAASLQRMGRELGVTIKELRPGKIMVSKPYSSQQVEMKLDGDYFAVVSLLQRLHEQERFCIVDSLEAKGTSAGVEWRVLMEIFCFSR